MKAVRPIGLRRRSGALAGALCAFAGAIVISTGALGGAASAQTSPTVTLTPSSGFQDQQLIDVSVGPNSVLAAGSNIDVVECAVGATSINQCDDSTLNGNTATTKSNGSFDLNQYLLFALPSTLLGESPGHTPVCNATTECVLGIGVQGQFGFVPTLFSAPFTIGAAPTTTTVATTMTTSTTVGPTTTTLAPVVQMNNTVTAGQAVTINGTDFVARASLVIQLSSTSGTLATPTADSSGAFQANVTIPATISPGTHTITVSQADGSDQAQFLITVAAAGATGTTTTTLTSTAMTSTTGVAPALGVTGTDSRRWSAAALALVGLGLLLLAAGWPAKGDILRRRSRGSG